MLTAVMAAMGVLASPAGAAQTSDTGSSAVGSGVPTVAPMPADTTTVPMRRVVGKKLVDASGQPVRLLGVDTTGTEDACVLGGKVSGWGPFDAVEAKSIAAWHTNAVRVPLNEDCWLGINGAPSNFSASTYRAQIRTWVAELNAAGLVAILDLHWSAPGAHRAAGQWPMPDASHSVNFWGQVAAAFKSDPSVIFDLFNEPYLGGTHPTAADWLCWRNGCSSSQDPCAKDDQLGCWTGTSYRVAGMQQLLDAVRASGARQPVMIGGLNWAGDPCGVKDLGGNGGSCAWLSHEPHDPDHQLLVSFHTYDWTACITVSCWESSVKRVARQVPVVTSEVGEKDCSDRYVDRYLQWADRNGISYLAWSWEPPLDSAVGCVAKNLDLLSNWSGSPDPANLVASAFKEHLAELAASHTAQSAVAGQVGRVGVRAPHLVPSIRLRGGLRLRHRCAGTIGRCDHRSHRSGRSHVGTVRRGHRRVGPPRSPHL